MLTGRLDLSLPVRLPGGEAGVAFSCPLDEACCIADVIRGHDREAGERPTRCWARVGGAWRQVHSLAVLAVKGPGDKGWVPNPAIFRLVHRAEPRRVF